MELPILTLGLADRLDQAVSRAALNRIDGPAGLADNPLDVEARSVGETHARLVRRGVGYYPFFSRPFRLRAGDHPLVHDLAQWYAHARQDWFAQLAPPLVDAQLLAVLADSGLRQAGFMSTLYTVAQPVRAEPAAGVTVRRIEASDLDAFLRLWTIEAPITELELRQRLARAEFSAWQSYVAEVDGQPVGHAAMYLDKGTNVAVFAAGGTLAQARGRGAQSALLRRRLADAAAAGVELAVCQARPGSTSERNLQRVGLRMAYTVAVWSSPGASRPG